MYVPSLRRCSLRVRTITAFTTVPFLAVPSGAASFTAAVTTSPRWATSPVPPPSGRIICSLRAPELSATSSMVLIITAIISLSPKDFAQGAHPCRRPLAMGGNKNLDRRLFDRGYLRGAADHVLQLPALQLRKRTRLLDLHHIAQLCRALLVVGIELLAALHHALVEGMRLLTVHFDNDGLGHLGGNHFADQGLAPSGGCCVAGFRCFGCLGHNLLRLRCSRLLGGRLLRLRSYGSRRRGLLHRDFRRGSVAAGNPL